MADFTSDLNLILPVDGYQSAALSTLLPMVAVNGTFTTPIISTNIPILIPTIRDTVPGPSSTNYYYMRGRDIDCGTLTYRYWVVANSPDASGAAYTGAKCGASSLADIVVEHTWSVSS